MSDFQDFDSAFFPSYTTAQSEPTHPHPHRHGHHHDEHHRHAHPNQPNNSSASISSWNDYTHATAHQFLQLGLLRNFPEFAHWMHPDHGIRAMAMDMRLLKLGVPLSELFLRGPVIPLLPAAPAAPAVDEEPRDEGDVIRLLQRQMQDLQLEERDTKRQVLAAEGELRQVRLNISRTEFLIKRERWNREQEVLNRRDAEGDDDIDAIREWMANIRQRVDRVPFRRLVPSFSESDEDTVPTLFPVSRSDSVASSWYPERFGRRRHFEGENSKARSETLKDEVKRVALATHLRARWVAGLPYVERLGRSENSNTKNGNANRRGRRTRRGKGKGKKDKGKGRKVE